MASNQLTTGVESRPGAEFDQLALSTGQLHVQHCAECASAVYPPRVLCHRCGSIALEWRPVTGEGIVHSVTELHSRAGRSHAVALVDLAEGFRMMATVPLGTPIDAPVRIVDLGDGDDLVVTFAPTAEVTA